mmetsp:Transcript_16131/g.45673  ORF Transcript_16131/g.45673 Transcript_16131/m.45673 type:complete len:234 (+) Transcript_16131:1181-1882(+)
MSSCRPSASKRRLSSTSTARLTLTLAISRATSSTTTMAPPRRSRTPRARTRPFSCRRTTPRLPPRCKQAPLRGPLPPRLPRPRRPRRRPPRSPTSPPRPRSTSSLSSRPSRRVLVGLGHLPIGLRNLRATTAIRARSTWCTTRTRCPSWRPPHSPTMTFSVLPTAPCPSRSCPDCSTPRRPSSTTSMASTSTNTRPWARLTLAPHLALETSARTTPFWILSRSWTAATRTRAR